MNYGSYTYSIDQRYLALFCGKSEAKKVINRLNFPIYVNIVKLVMLLINVRKVN